MKVSGVNLTDYLVNLAKTQKKGYGSFKLKDGSTVSILNNKSNSIDFYQTKNGYLLGAKGFGGKKAIREGMKHLISLTEQEAKYGAACDAFVKSLAIV